MRGMGGILSSKLVSCDAYSQTRQAGWGLKRELSTVEIEQIRAIVRLDLQFFSRKS